MNGSEIGLLELIKSIDSGFFYIMVAVTVLIVMTFIISVYTAVRTEKLWSLTRSDHDIARIKKEVRLDLQSRPGLE